MPFAIALFVVLGGLDAMNNIGATYFCDPGLRNCNDAVLGFLDFATAWWWATVIALSIAGQVTVGVCVIFDSALPTWQRICWLTGLVVVGVVAAPGYCIIRLHQLGPARSHANG